LWAATGYGVQLFDRMVDPPRLIASAAVPGTTRTIDVRSGVAYAGSGTAVYVVRRNGDQLELLGGNDVGAEVNDVLATSTALFVATDNGLFAFDRRDPLSPAGMVLLPTSSPTVYSLSRNGDGEVYAADGDSSVERFVVAGTIQAGGSLSALPRSMAVTVTGSHIFVSDGQQTDIFFINGSPQGRSPVGALTAAALADDVYFVAGADRRFQAVDLRIVGQPVELFAGDIIPTGGNVNAIGAIIHSNDRVYVAGGDAGLLTIDIAEFRAPYPLLTQAFTAKTSVVDAGGSLFTANTAGGLTELLRFSSGSLGTGREWAPSQTHAVHHYSGNILLTSSGPTLSRWATGSSGTPTTVASATFPAAIQDAAMSGTRSVVLLTDGSIWTAELSAGTATPVRVNIASAHHLAASDGGVAVARLTDSGTTDIAFYPGGNFAASPISASVPGAATAFAISGSRVALFTFRGITIVDFAGGVAAETLLPQSNSAVVRDLGFAGNQLIDITSAALRVWDLSSRRLTRSFTLSSEPSALAIHPSAAVATVLHSETVTTVRFDSTTRQAAQIGVTTGNRYPRKAVAAGDRLFVFDGQTIDIYGMSTSAAPDHRTVINVAGAMDLAASESRLFVLFGDARVAAYTHGGSLLGSTKLDEGADMIPLGISEAAGAPWIAISRGCLSTGCEERTIVLDP
ncbi:MAG TPA: hypothetical protein VFT12_04160, partial [Thermoanaerobaculia bacterium]|nr:hypothetical protein [Thermoanaerobaculia bacterium]